MRTKFSIPIVIILIGAIGFAAYLIHRQSTLPVMQSKTDAPAQTVASQSSSSPISSATPAIIQSSTLAEPISGDQSRVTKKPFGIYVTPGHSPVSPERFTGFHTGTDFETTPEEQQTDVPISAICDGPLLLKKYASGYGGIAVQSCTINGEKDTVLYGHLRLSSITPNIGGELKAGQQFAVLGIGYSTETDGERKHLHLSIHKGTSIALLGYVQKQSELSAWTDPATVLP